MGVVAGFKEHIPNFCMGVCVTLMYWPWPGAMFCRMEKNLWWVAAPQNLQFLPGV
jgi:hypothetical protein